tara:strand:+ start:734 stop:1345 length:612 start_codon:yes stop_codon:yes gene_type:complete
MKATEILTEIKKVLGIELTEEASEKEVSKEVELATMKLDNGTEIEAESFEANKEVFIVGEGEEKIALPVGEYTLEDGKILAVTEEGIIGEIKEAGSEEEASTEEKEDVEATEEPTSVKSEETTHKVVYATKEEVEKLSSSIAELKAMIESKKEEEVNEVEMSAEVVEPIAHNPEAVTESEVNMPTHQTAHARLVHQIIQQYNN